MTLSPETPPYLTGQEAKPMSSWTRSQMGYWGENKEQRKLHPPMPRLAGYINPSHRALQEERHRRGDRP